MSGAIVVHNDSDKPVTLLLDSGASVVVGPGETQTLLDSGAETAIEEYDRLKGPDPLTKVDSYAEAFEEVLELFPVAFRNMA